MGLNSWQALLDGVLPVVQAAVTAMRAAETDAPEELLEVYQTFTAHEQALLDFMLLEREGKSGAHLLESYIASVSQQGDQ